MSAVPLIGRVPAPELHVMTYNIRRQLPTWRRGSPDRWSTRAPLLRRLLAAEQPTLLGVQEALPAQAEFVAAALGDGVQSVGRGREAGGAGEQCLVYFDAERLRLEGWEQLALSATPDVPGSRSWGNRIPRVAVRASFTDAATGARLVVVNTHFDHISARSRRRSAAMILDLVVGVLRDDPGAAVVVMGDLNTGERSATVRALTADGTLRDAWAAAADRLTPGWGTFSWYRPPREGARRIDFLLVGPGVEVLRVGINAARFDGAAPSDHEPVQAVLRLPTRGSTTEKGHP